MSDHPDLDQIKDRLYYFERQDVYVDVFDSPGFILDIGGGGEGIIARLKGRGDILSPVISIDLIWRELKRAPHGPLKIVMDARKLDFLDCSFPTVTAFFSIMYLKPEDHLRIFQEVYRVLAPDGQFLVWDVILPARHDRDRDIAAFPITVHLPDEDVDTGYGYLWPEQDQNLDYYTRTARQVGFKVIYVRERGQTFFLELQKPA